MEKNINNDGTYTVSCSKCKQIEDTFEKDEKPEDFNWVFYRNKWYCSSCRHKIKK